MTIEKFELPSFKWSIIIDRATTKWGDEETEFGRHRIQPRDGKFVDIMTPQRRILFVRQNDIIHLIGEDGKVTSKFTSKDLPEGYTIVEPLKGDIKPKPKPSQ